MKARYVIATGLLGFFACQNQGEENLSANTEKEVVVDTVIVTQNNEEEINDLIQVLDLQESEIEGLEKEKALAERKSDLFYKKIHQLQSENDSLRTVNHSNMEMINKLNKEADAGMTTDDFSIRSMVFALHQSWKELPQTQNPDNVIRFFLPEYQASQVGVSTENQAEIKRYTHKDFRAYLEKTTKDKDLTIEFGDVHFLSEEIKDKLYFNVSYKCVVRVYNQDKPVSDNSIVVTVTGKKVEGKWMIGSFSWVSFRYED